MTTQRTIPVILITGYLGVGKTTLVNHLLSLPEIANQSVSLVINEFGPVGIDAQLIADAERPKYEINKGSLFCTCTKHQFMQTLDSIIHHSDTELVIIEASGMAQTAELERYLDDPALEQRLAIWTNLCLIEPASFIKVLPFLPAVSAQVRMADALVLNKPDITSASDLEAVQKILEELNPQAKRLQTQYAQLSFKTLQQLSHAQHAGVPTTVPPANIVAVCFKAYKPIDRVVFAKTVERLRNQLLRMKGNVAFADETNFVEFTHDTLHYQPVALNLSSVTSLALIARDISKGELMDAFEACQS